MLKKISAIFFVFLCALCLQNASAQAPSSQDFKVEADRFADIKILRYVIPGYEKLTLSEKLQTYYLAQAILSGRDIMYDQNCKYNLTVRRTLEQIVLYYEGNRENAEFKKFMVYAKQFWAANGMHHHYSSEKIIPGCSYWAFLEFLYRSPKAKFPMREGERMHEFAIRLYDPMFNPTFMPIKVSSSTDGDVVVDSAVNFYEGVTAQEVDDFYAKKIDPNDLEPPSWGLNSKLVKKNGEITEKVWKVGGMYGEALSRVVYWLEKAETVTEDAQQKLVISLLIQYLKSGDLKDFDRYSIEWVKSTNTHVDFILGFIEVYDDPKGRKGSFGGILQIVDPEMTSRMSVLFENAQWFEEHAPILPQHKKAEVSGVTWRAINVVGASGDNSPTSPIGVNLPNSEWIRERYGSKSINLANIKQAYNQAASAGLLNEFCYSLAELERARLYGEIADMLGVALHEFGHGSGKLEDGVQDMQILMGTDGMVLEEGRADLFDAYFILDLKLIELQLLSTLEVGKAEYDDIIRNGMMLQLSRISLGKDIEQTHMRNRQLIAKWVYEKGLPDNVIEKKVKDGETFFVINDYEKLRELFGQLLCEIQRIKSQGDKTAGVALVQKYGVKIDRSLHAEVLARFESINSGPPYAGFMNPRLVPIYDENGEITDVSAEYPADFVDQMLEYGRIYSFLPNEN